MSQDTKPKTVYDYIQEWSEMERKIIRDALLPPERISQEFWDAVSKQPKPIEEAK